ncbi:MAG: BtaA family protein [Alphaproteobacteria bacterium]|nr:BtaA family protein [Alphaproteobacteria bacterium]
MVDRAGTDRSIADRADFGLIRYAQVWEDADVLLAGLRPKPGEVVVSVASAGDNALALLTADPSRVVAFDLSAAQLECLRIRIAAYRALVHAELLELMGSRPSKRRGDLLMQCLEDLDDVQRAFWLQRKDAVCRYGLGGVGKFERYFRYFRRFVLPLMHSRLKLRSLMQPKTTAERIRFYEHRWNTWRWRLLLRFFFSRRVMGALGRDPAFFDFIEGSVADHIAGKTRFALVDQDPSTNPYLHWILFGTHGDALPLALRPEHFETVRARLDRIELRQCSIEDLPGQGFRGDAFNLSDVFEYMPLEHFEQCYEGLLSMANPGARLMHWNMMAPRVVPSSCTKRIVRDAVLEAELKARDKAFFYSDLVVGEVAR